MNPELITTVLIVILGFLLLFSGMHLGLAMGLFGFLGLLHHRGLNHALGELMTVPYALFSYYDLTVIPLFILMGQICFHAGMSADLFGTGYKWFGRMRGGLAMATVAACAGFAAVCGSSPATAVTMGLVALPEMKKYQYDKALATGSVAAGGTIGVLIPPSLSFILYGIMTGQSIGQLFLGGVLPGVLQAILFIVTIYLLCTKNPGLGPGGPGAGLREKIVSLKNTWIVLFLFIAIIGSLYMGICTPTEAAAVGAFLAFVFGAAKRRFTWKSVRATFQDTVRSTSMLMIIFAGATIMSHFLAVTRLPTMLANVVVAMEVNRFLILGLILFIYVILGCLMDPGSMLLLTIPTFYPVIVALHFDPIWFGVLVAVMTEVGCITPPVGLNVFVIHGIAPDVPMYTIFRGIIPFLVTNAVLIAVLILFPPLALLLPSTMK
ncbi:MAG: TRAP transporter large permease [Thermodesulfobacteriota bacterium]